MSILHRLVKIIRDYGKQPIDLAPSGLSPFYHRAEVWYSGQLVLWISYEGEERAIVFSARETNKLYNLLRQNITGSIKSLKGTQLELTEDGGLVLYWNGIIRYLTQEETSTLFTLLHSNRKVIG